MISKTCRWTYCVALSKPIKYGYCKHKCVRHCHINHFKPSVTCCNAKLWILSHTVLMCFFSFSQ